jgi:hypothetical protein
VGTPKEHSYEWLQVWSTRAAGGGRC